MNDSKENIARFERIEGYILGRMTREQSEKFELELAQNNELAHEVEALKDSILSAQISGFHDDLSSVVHDADEDKSSKVISLYPLLGLAAGIALLVGVYLWMQEAVPVHQQLYAAYYTPDPGTLTAMGSEETRSYLEAMVDYKAGEYESALAQWNLLLDERQSDTLEYYISAAQMALGKMDEAKAGFQHIARDTASSFQDDALWYLGLCYLKAGEIHQFKALDFPTTSIYHKEWLRLRSELE